MRELCAHGHSVLVQSGAGAAIGLSDALYQSAGAVARTSTFALNNATLAHAVALADKGWQQAISDNPHLKAGLNVELGLVTHEAVAHALGLAYVPAERVLCESAPSA